MIVWLFLLPGVSRADQEFTQKSAAVAIVQSLSSAREQIGRRILERQTTSKSGVGITFAVQPAPSATWLDRFRSPPQPQLHHAFAGENGTLVGVEQRWGVVVVLDPSYSNGSVEWQCKVFPSEAAPRLCK